MLELAEKRKENSKTYDLGGGRFATDIHKGSVHYKDDYADGEEQWKDINTTINEVDGALTVSNAPYNLTIYNDRIGFRIDSKIAGWIEIEVKGNPNLSNRTVNGNRITYINAFDDIDIIIEARNEGAAILKKIKVKVSKKIRYKIKQNKGARHHNVQEFLNCTDAEGNQVEASQVRVLVDENGDTETHERVEDIKDKKIDGTEPVYPVTVDVIINPQVSAGTDDGMGCSATGFWYLTLAYLYLGSLLGNEYGTAIRFAHVNVPKDAVIDVAYLAFNAYGSNSGVTCREYFYVEDQDNPVTYSTLVNFMGRAWSDISVAWDPVPGWVEGYPYVTPSIVSLVQRIVNRAGWVANNAMSFAGVSIGSGSNAYRRPWSYNGASWLAPILHIEYTYGVAIVKVVNETEGVVDTSVSKLFRALVKVVNETAGLIESVVSKMGLVRVVNETEGIGEEIVAVGGTPIFDLVPEFEYVQRHSYSVLKSSFTDGAVMRRAVHDRRMREFDLRWKNATRTERDRLVWLYKNRRGRAGIMFYVPVDESSEIKVRFSEDSLSIPKKQHGNYEMSVKLIEVL